MTTEQLELEYEQTNSLLEKKIVLDKITSEYKNNLSLSSDDKIKISELLSNLNEDYKILLADFNKEENQKCLDDIDNLNLSTRKCINKIFDCIVGESYYIKIDDIASEYRGKGIDQISEEISEYISKIEPIVTIYCDKGIGTLKFRKVLTNDLGKLEDFFQ